MKTIKRNSAIKCCLIWIKWKIYLVNNQLSYSQGIVKVKVFIKNLRCFYVKLDRMKMYKLYSFYWNLEKKVLVLNNYFCFTKKLKTGNNAFFFHRRVCDWYILYRRTITKISIIEDRKGFSQLCRRQYLIIHIPFQNFYNIFLFVSFSFHLCTKPVYFAYYSLHF